MPSNFTTGQSNAIAEGRDRGLSAFFAYYGTSSHKAGEFYACLYLKHLSMLFPLLDEKSEASAPIVHLPARDVYILNYAVFLFHLLRFLFRRNYANCLEAERNIVNRTIDLLAGHLAKHDILEPEVTSLVEKFRDEWISQKCPSDLTMFLWSSAAKFTDRNGAAAIALSGGDIEGFIMTQIYESKDYGE